LVFLVLLYIGIQLIFVEKQELDMHPEVNAAINKVIEWGGLI
jgi:hypothetical protein